MPLIAVSANDIDTPGISLDVELPTAWLDKELSETDATSPRPGRLTARLSRSGGDIVVRGRVDASLSMPCARCLKPSPIPIESELSLLLRPSSRSEGAQGAGRAAGAAHHRGAHAHAPERATAGRAQHASGSRANGSTRNGGESTTDRRRAKEKEIEYEFTAEEADIDTFDGETVVLDDFVREAILLELPNFPLCSEACPGIGPVAPAPDLDVGATSDRVDPRLAPLGALRDKLRKTAEPASAREGQEGQGAVKRPPSRAAARPLLRSSSAATKTKKKKRNKE